MRPTARPENRQNAADATGQRLHDDDAVAKINRLVDVMCDQDRGDAFMAHDAPQFVLQPEARQGIQRPREVRRAAADAGD